MMMMMIVFDDSHNTPRIFQLGRSPRQYASMGQYTIQNQWCPSRINVEIVNHSAKEFIVLKVPLKYLTILKS